MRRSWLFQQHGHARRLDARLHHTPRRLNPEGSRLPELCVLQVANDEIVAAVDCLAPIDLEPLFEALLAADATWVLHSARQDLEVLVNRAGRLPRALVDTQIAAALIGSPLVREKIPEDADTPAAATGPEPELAPLRLPEALLADLLPASAKQEPADQPSVLTTPLGATAR